MKDNVEESAGMGVPASAAVEADPDEVAEGGVGGGGMIRLDPGILVKKSNKQKRFMPVGCVAGSRRGSQGAQRSCKERQDEVEVCLIRE